jgi:hypothetical protein
MLDIVAFVFFLLFFALGIAYVSACDRLKGTRA